MLYDWLKEAPQQRSKLFVDGWHTIYTCVPYALQQELLWFIINGIQMNDANLYIHKCVQTMQIKHETREVYERMYIRRSNYYLHRWEDAVASITPNIRVYYTGWTVAAYTFIQKKTMHV